MLTTVVNIKHDECDVYVGREGHGMDGYFGNPHTVYNPLKKWTVCPICKVKHMRGEALAAFRKDFAVRIETDLEFRRRVLQLRGKVLGCFCVPAPCHAEVYAEWLNSHPDLVS